MKTLFLPEEKLAGFVDGLMAKTPVIGPVAKRGRFVFEQLDDAEELRLDYDTTILPPKKVFFPSRQDLLAFEGGEAKACSDPKEQVLFGVHPHDMKAITMTDFLFTENYPDNNYLANRDAATIVTSGVQNHYKNAFFGSINTDMPVEGHDMALTKIDGGYFVEVLTGKGEKLIECGDFTEASGEQKSAAEKVNAEAMANCPEKLNSDAESIQKKVRDSFSSPIWEEFSEDCFSCGSCNLVCPTCYCFDVQDEWGLGECDGKRYRRWDACLTSEFSEATAQGGTENFRETRAERYRHRFMRKAAYLNEKLGGPACIGCGRCSGACTADIANPVTTIKKIMES